MTGNLVWPGVDHAAYLERFFLLQARREAASTQEEWMAAWREYLALSDGAMSPEQREAAARRKTERTLKEAAKGASAGCWYVAHEDGTLTFLRRSAGREDEVRHREVPAKTVPATPEEFLGVEARRVG